MNTIKTIAKRIIEILSLITLLFSSGCFSAFSRSDLGGGKQTAGAAAADVVTFPVQAVVLPPVYAVAKMNESTRERKAKETAEERKHLMGLLESDPAIVIRERWDLKKDQHFQVLIDSFSNPNVKYTSNLLEEIYKTCPDMQDYVFNSPYCSQEFLAKHFDEDSRNPDRFCSIVENRNTPIELVEKVAFSNNYPEVAVACAKLGLKQRKPEVQMH